jgi:hypothetical protein
VLQQAIDWAADPAWRADESAAPGSYLEAAQKLPAFRTSKVYLHLWPENAVHMNWDKPLARFGGKTAFEMAVEGFACHASQQQWFQVGRKGVFDCMAFGLYYTNVGADTRSDDPDFFEHIGETDFSDYEPPVSSGTPEVPQEQQEEPPAQTEPEPVPAAPKKGNMVFLLGGCCAAAGIVLCLIAMRRAQNKKYKGKH